MKQNQEDVGDGLLVVLLSWCLIFALHVCNPQVVFAHSEHTGTAAEGTGEGQEISRGEDEVVNADWTSEKTGDFLPLDTEFIDSAGRSGPLRAIIDRPTLILPIYFYCPNSCSLDLSRLAAALKSSTFKPGIDFRVIAFSFNAEETVEAAGDAKKNYLKQLPDDFPVDAWRFLVGNRESILALTGALGYTFKRMADGSFVHPSALVAISADGRVIKYVYGSFLSGDVDMALLEAKKGTPAVSVKRFLRYCFNNDSKKSVIFLQNLKVVVLLGFAVLGGLFLWFLTRSGRKRAGAGEGRK
jgi:protein SCO1